MGSSSLLPLLVAAGLAAFAVDPAQAQYEGTTSTSFTPRAPYGFVSVEFMTLPEIEAALPLLSARKLGIVLSWPSSQIDNPAYYELVRRAHAVGVEVHPWLLLPESSGYWANSINAVEFDGAARRLLARWISERIRPTAFLVDMEPPVQRALEYAQVLARFQVDDVVRFLRAGINREQYAAGTRVYRDLVNYAHSIGFKVELSTISQVVDDYADGDDDLRQAFNIPVAGIDWDLYGIQVYRTLNQFVIGSVAGPTTSYYVYDYALRARAIFGRKAALAIGLVDPGDVTPDATVYENGRDLRKDLDAARAAGFSREEIGVYALRGILRRSPVDQWFPTTSLFSLPPLPDLPTIVTRSTTALFDTRL